MKTFTLELLKISSVLKYPENPGRKIGIELEFTTAKTFEWPPPLTARYYLIRTQT